MRLIVVALVLAAFAYALRPLAIPALPRDTRALEFVDRNGLPMGTILGRGERRTLPVSLARVSPAFLAAVVAVEDRRFFFHGAVDWPAALRALFAGMRGGTLPGGASTISMQVARMIEPVPPGLSGKLREIWLAARLENGNAKDAILGAYCNLAPMGSNIYGVEAAARTYFGSDAAHLDLAQAALLAAIPNDPVGLDPYRHRAALERRRAYVLARMVAAGMLSASGASAALREHVALNSRTEGIIAAPHFLFHLAPRVPDGVARVRTTIDRGLQEFVETQVRDVVAGLGRFGMRHAAALVVDNHTGEVLAYVGSPDYFDEEDLGRNDGVTALRQPGSALKPFLYELALERRAIRPDTIVPDVPTAYALPEARVYEPVDYSQRYLGPVRPRIALADSLNVPAVRVLERVGVGTFLQRLHALGFAHLDKSAEYYGLGLTLGGGEVTLAELAHAYVAAARGGRPVQFAEIAGEASVDSSEAQAPVDPAWALVTDYLSDAHARAAAFGVDSILALPFPVAAKTGTSSQYRDVWTAGYTRDYTVAVWAGNFDGAPMHGISGVTGAGPLWARIMLHLHETHPAAPFAPPDGYVRRTICAENGALAGRPLAAESTTAAGCTPVSEWFDGHDVARLALGAPRVAPATAEYDRWLVNQPESAAMATRILFPNEGDVFVYEPRGGARQRFAIEIAGTRTGLSLAIDGHRLVPKGGDFLWRLTPGKHEIVARSPTGAARVAFDVVRNGPRRRQGFTRAAPP